MENPLAHCTRCNQLFIDTNASVSQRKYDVNAEYIASLITLKQEHTDITIIDETTYQGCPDCKTDVFLEKVKDDIILDYHHTVESIEVYQYQIEKKA